jgi:nucleoside-diphosphate-sugar epimerase
MKLLVTGCAGFIGSTVVDLLHGQGHSVVGIDNVNDAYDVRLKEWRLQRLEQLPNLSFLKLDITDRTGLEALFQEHKFDAVINLAARAGVRQSIENPWVYVSTNIEGNLNLLDLCRAHGVLKYILASTSSLYGGAERPFSELSATDRPLSPYAASKKGAEAMCHAYHHLHGIDVSILRFFTVYGPAGRPDMSIFRFVKWVREDEPLWLSGDGTQERDFTYVGDVARGVAAALKPLGFEIINLGGNQPYSLRSVISMVENYTGHEALIEHYPFHPADVMATWADVTKARELLEWQTQVSMEEGLKSSVAWYEENRSWAKDVNLD